MSSSLGQVWFYGRYILTVIGWIYIATNITRGSYMHARSQKKRIFRSQQQNLRKFMGIWTTLLESAANSRELSKAWASSSLLFEWPWKLALYKPLQALYLFFLVEGIKRCFYSFYWMPNTKKTSFIFDTWHASCVPKYIYNIYLYTVTRYDHYFRFEAGSSTWISWIYSSTSLTQGGWFKPRLNICSLLVHESCR